MNVEPSPSRDDTEHLAAVVRGHVAHDGQAEAGAAGVAAAALVDAVEALEDALEVAAPGCRCRGRRPSARPSVPSTLARTCTATAGVGVLHGVLEQVAERRDQLAAVAADREPSLRSSTSTAISMPRPRRAGRTRSTASATTSPIGDRLA